ncbi:MAG TPA: hypothetical protein VFN75_01200 [Pseudonocardiaceae bacterium]|nr:hypothetical protein [Pseudonocardiaceae bacterium]
MRAQARLAAAALVLAVGIIGLVDVEAAASSAGARAAAHHITGTAGNSGQLLCGVSTRTKGLPGGISMVLNHAPAGRLLVRLQDAKNGKFFGEQKVLTAGKTPATLVGDVLAGTQFHVCAASPSGSPGGPYDAELSY